VLTHVKELPVPLDQRKQEILKAVVDDYIETAEPVGSKNLIARHAFSVSSATIRNEMAELEEQGYLEHPHTSSGRIPSDKGYRAYVDNLLRPIDLPVEEAERIRACLRDCLDEVTELIRRATSILSENTGYTSLILTPQLRKGQLKQIKMLMIEPGRALVVVVLAAGVVKDRLVRIPSVIDSAQLMQVAAAIEEGLSGMKLDDITLVTVASAARKSELPESLLNQVLYEAYIAIKQADNLEVYMDGTNKVLSYPEFHDIHKARGFFDALSRDKLIAGYMNELREDDAFTSSPETEANQSAEPVHSTRESGLQIAGPGLSRDSRRPAYMVRIGQEIALDGLSDCSFVTTAYRIGETVAGHMGVIGPRRMAYDKVISNINFIKMALDDQMRRITGIEAETEEKET
jgi:heat-inducible transcriptional repressor